MADKWDEYAENTDDWEQFAEEAPSQSVVSKPPSKSILETATTPIVSKENVLGSDLGRFMADASPFTQVGGNYLPPPFSMMIPPNIRRNLTAEMISSETSPLAIGSNLLALKGLQSAKELPKLLKLGGKGTAQKIAEAADKGFETANKVVSGKYDALFDRIKSGSIKNNKVFESIRSVTDTYPEAAGVPKLKKIMERLSNVDEISAKELHDLKQVVRKSIPRSVWNGTAEADAVQNAMRDIYFTITDELATLGGEEYKGLSQEYRKVKESERLAKKMFYKSGVPSNEPLAKELDIPTKRAIRTIDDMLPEQERFANDFMAWRRGQKAKGIAKHAIGYGLALGGLGGVGGAIAGRMLERR